MIQHALAAAIRRANRSLAALPVAKSTLAVAVAAGGLVACSSDSSNSSSFTFVPNPVVIGAPTAAGFGTFSDSYQINGLVNAGSADELVSQIAITASVAQVDASGNLLLDASGNTDNLSAIVGAPQVVADPPLGDQTGGFYWQADISVLSTGTNLMEYTATYPDNPDALSADLGGVIRGNSWMRELAIQYDPADPGGNSYLLLDQLDTGAGTGILRVDATDGTKERIDLDQTGLSDGDLDRPVDFLLDDTTAYILDGDTPRLIQVADITAGTPVLSDVTDCGEVTDELALVDPVAFAYNPAAVGSEPRFFVADRGSKEIILIDADDNCTVLPTLRATEFDDPLSDDVEDTLLVSDAKAILPYDIAYHAATETLFVTGGWLLSTSIAVEETLVDASGNPILDASGNEQTVEVARETSQPSNNFGVPSILYKIELGEELDASGNPTNLDRLHRQQVNYVSETGPSEEGGSDDTVFRVNQPGSLLIDGDRLFIVDRFAGINQNSEALAGVLVADVSDGRPRPTDMDATPMQQPEDYVFTPVSGFYTGQNIGSLDLGNPSNRDFKQLLGVESFAIRSDQNQLVTYSSALGSYLTIELAPPAVGSGCIGFVGTGADPDNANRIQCDFDGTRNLVPGGASVARIIDDDGTDEIEFTRTGRANFDPRILTSLVNDGADTLAFDRLTGEFSLNLGVLGTLFASEDNGLPSDDNSGLLFSDARALVSDGVSIYAVASFYDAEESCVPSASAACIPEQSSQLIEFSIGDRTRSIVEPDAVGSAIEFMEPVASEVVLPRVWTPDIGDLVGDDLDNRLAEISFGIDLYTADSSFAGSGTIIKTELDQFELDLAADPAEVVDNETRGTRTLLASNCPAPNLGAVTAMARVRFSSSDINDDGNLTTQGTGDFDESDGNVFETLSALLLATDNNELLAVDLLLGDCVQIASFPSPVNSLQITEQQTERDDTDGSDQGGVLRRAFRVVAMSPDDHTLFELQCEENDPRNNLNAVNIACGTPGSGSPVAGPPLALGLNASDGNPVDSTFIPSPATFTFFPGNRAAFIFDDRTNATYLSDMSFREDSGPGAGGPTDTEDDADLATRQTVITVFGSALNCDPENFPAACRNL